MNIKRKPLNKYEWLTDNDSFSMDNTLESIYNALQDTDSNNFIFTQTLVEQNQLLLNQIVKLKEQLNNMEMKINYLLDNSIKNSD